MPCFQPGKETHLQAKAYLYVSHLQAFLTCISCIRATFALWLVWSCGSVRIDKDRYMQTRTFPEIILINVGACQYRVARPAIIRNIGSGTLLAQKLFCEALQVLRQNYHVCKQQFFWNAPLKVLLCPWSIKLTVSNLNLKTIWMSSKTSLALFLCSCAYKQTCMVTIFPKFSGEPWNNFNIGNMPDRLLGAYDQNKPCA